MIIDRPDLLLFIVFAPLTGVSIIARQLIRESLFARILKAKNFPIGARWYSIRQGGIGTSLSRELVWGPASKDMLKEKQLRFLILAARMFSITLCVGFSGVMLTMLWVALLHYR